MDKREKFYRYFKRTLSAVLIPVGSILLVTIIVVQVAHLPERNQDLTGNYTGNSSSSYYSSTDSYTSKESSSSSSYSYPSSSSYSSSTSYSTYSSSSSFSYDPTSYLGLTLSTFSYREFTEMFGKPDEFVSNKAYYNNISRYGSIALGYDGYNGNGFSPYSDQTIKFIEIYGDSNVEIVGGTFLGGTLSYYNDRLSFNAFDALEMGAGDHGASWYELPVIYTTYDNYRYSVDYLFVDQYSECYGARISYLGQLAYGM